MPLPSGLPSSPWEVSWWPYGVSLIWHGLLFSCCFWCFWSLLIFHFNYYVSWCVPPWLILLRYLHASWITYLCPSPDSGNFQLLFLLINLKGGVPLLQMSLWLMESLCSLYLFSLCIMLFFLSFAPLNFLSSACSSPLFAPLSVFLISCIVFIVSAWCFTLS